MSILQKIAVTSIAFTVALNASVALARVNKINIDVSKLPSSVLTTIADVKKDQDGALVYANNDIRVLKISSESNKMIEEATLAKKNGWEVKLSLKPSDDGKFQITSLQIKSRKNTLTDGFNMPDTKFSPIIAHNESEAQKLFKSVYPYDSDNYDVNDNCFNRAQYWSRMQQVAQKVKGSDKGTDKVFIFFTEEYRRKYDHKWWYHVAPMIYVGNKSNPVVLDPTFMSEAVSLQDWLAAFDHFTDGNCLKAETLDDLYDKADQPICLYITASMFNYIPTDLSTRNRLTNWRCSDFERVKAAIPAPGAHTFARGATWSDKKNQFLLPEMCGGPTIAGSTPVPTPTPNPVPEPTPVAAEDDKPEPDSSLTATTFVGRIIGDSDAELRAGAGSDHNLLGRIPKNTKVNMILTGHDWLEVVVPAGILGADSVRGFVSKTQIELVR